MPRGIYVRTDEHKRRIGNALRGKKHLTVHIIHGESRTKLYGVWKSMKYRCLNRNDMRYSRYGGRGISICEQWLYFIPFRNWALCSGYKEGLTIDRINNGGNYEPDNCQWITKNQNSSKDNYLRVRG